jgi:hypothetical protein
MCNSQLLKGGISMKVFGVIVSALGLVILALSFGSDTAPEGTYNLGLLQHQMMMFSLGGLLLLVGAVVGSIGYALGRMEAAGLLPPSGVSVSKSALPRKA